MLSAQYINKQASRFVDLLSGVSYFERNMEFGWLAKFGIPVRVRHYSFSKRAVHFLTVRGIAYAAHAQGELGTHYIMLRQKMQARFIRRSGGSHFRETRTVDTSASPSRKEFYARGYKYLQ